MTLDFVSRHSFLLTRQSFSAIFSSLCCDSVVKCRDMSSTAICLDQCHDIQILFHDKVLSSDFLYVSTLTYLSQHLSVSFSNIMSRQSCEISQQTSFFDSVQLDLCCDITLLVAT